MNCNVGRAVRRLRKGGFASLVTVAAAVVSVIAVRGKALAETTPPTPDPMTWGAPPHAESSSSIGMTATQGSDATPPVEYLFERVYTWEEAGNGSGSGGGISNNPGNSGYAACCVDGAGKPVVAWQDDTSGDYEVYVRRFTGTAWEEVGVGSATGSGISNTEANSFEPAICADSQGRLLVAWAETGKGIYVLRFDGGAWEEVGAGSASGSGIGGEGSPSICVDSSDRPIVAWEDASSGNQEIYVRRFNGAAWDEVGAGSASGGGISNTRRSYDPKVCVDGSGRPVVAWCDTSGWTWAVYVKRFNGISWEEMGVGSASGDGISNTSRSANEPDVCVDAAGSPIVVWKSYRSSGGLVSVAEIYGLRFRGTTWQEVGAGSSTGGGISDTDGNSFSPSICLDGGGRAVVAWVDDASGAREVYAKRFNGTGWEEAGAGSATGGGVSNRGNWAESAAVAPFPPSSAFVAWSDLSDEVYVRSLGTEVLAESGWQTSSEWTDTGLPVNTRYGYRVKARDSAAPPNETEWSEVRWAYTLAEPPTEPFIDRVGTTSIDISPKQGLNPQYTQLAVRIYDGTAFRFLQTIGGRAISGPRESWLALWGRTEIVGLVPGTTYWIDVKARNGDGIETDYGPQCEVATVSDADGDHVYVHARDGSDDFGDGTQWAPWETIQYALDHTHAWDSVCVHVAAGTYYGPVALDGDDELTSLWGGYNPDDWSDRRYETRADREDPTYRTVITGDRNGDGSGEVPCLRFSDIWEAGRISGFVIRSGKGDGPESGGISCYGSSPAIMHNTFADNEADRGGATQCGDGSHPAILHNVFTGNSAVEGGAIYFEESDPTIAHNVMVGNAAFMGGAICSGSASWAAVMQNTICGNSASTGSGICVMDAPLAVANCILHGNTAGDGSQVAISGTFALAVSYCDVEGGEAAVKLGGGATLDYGPGNIDAAPLFAGPAFGDFHLMSRAGRYEPVTGAWVLDGQHSPCIDAGDPASGVGDEPTPNADRINMGAYGGTAHASKSYPTILSIAPGSGPPGTQVTITGAGFGEEQGSGYVLFGFIPAPVVSWSPQQIIVLVPNGLTPGEVNVTVTTDAGVTSDAGTFTAEEPPRATLTATVQLEGYTGSPGAVLELRFVFSDAEGAELARRHVRAAFTHGRDTEEVVIDDLPIDTRIVSCKEPGHFLRRRVDVGGAGSNLTADFTGANQLLGGDLNDDNFVELRDFAQFLRDFGRPDRPQTDINGDGDVDNIEFGYIGLHFFQMGDPE